MPTNLLTDPLFATDVTVPGLADHWTALRNTVTAPVFSLVTGGQSMVYSGEGSDTGSQYAGFYQNSAPGSFAPGQTAAFSAVLSGTCTGGIAQVNLIACTSGGGYIAEVDLTVALTSVPTLFTASYANLPATTSYVQVFIVAVSLTSAAVVNIVTNDAALLLGNVVTVTGTIGPAADGATATFMPIGFGTQLFWDQDGLLQVSATATAPATVNAVCDVNGSFSAVLFATDNLEAVSGPLPAGWTWTLNVIAPASGQPAGVNPSQVLYTANTFYVSYANGATQELSEILPLPAPGAIVSLIGEILRAEAAETLISGNLLYETSRAETAESNLSNAGTAASGSLAAQIVAEIARAEGIESTFSTGLLPSMIGLVTLASAYPTVAVDASLGNYFRLTILPGQSNLTIASPTGGTDGQRITFELINTFISGTAYSYCSFDYSGTTKYVIPASGTWGDLRVVAGNGLPASSTLGRVFISFIYNAVSGFWYTVDYQPYAP